MLNSVHVRGLKLQVLTEMQYYDRGVGSNFQVQRPYKNFSTDHIQINQSHHILFDNIICNNGNEIILFINLKQHSYMLCMV